MNSQNGWSVIGSGDLDKAAFPGTSIVPLPGIRKGDVATVLHYVGQQFNARVEALYNPGCWGYANRAIIGGSDTSNHASGTAIDLNAPSHPLGKSGTFSQSQLNAIREILNHLEGVVRWGGDYAGRKDEMHFEIVGNSEQVARIARKIRGEDTTPITTPAHESGTLKRGTWNVRSGPSTDYGSIGIAHGGESYKIEETRNGWKRVIFTGRQGWIGPAAWGGIPAPARQQHIETVKKGTWYVRSGASTNSKILGTVGGGDRYDTEVLPSKWRRITYKGLQGFVGPAAW